MGQFLENLKPFLHSTKLINARHVDIRSKLLQLINDGDEPAIKASKLFYFMRDQIRYAFYAGSDEDDYYASNILAKRKGFCTQKAILFCALARAAKIPAGIYFYDIVDYTLPDSVVELLRTKTLYRHGIVSLFLSGKWIKYDATLDSQLVQRNNLFPVEFSATEDCLMFDKTKDSRKHIEYVRDYGLYSDCTFDEISTWFKKHYSHLLH
jgi:transglutaminase-like putative cysteine protease